MKIINSLTKAPFFTTKEKSFDSSFGFNVQKNSTSLKENGVFSYFDAIKNYNVPFLGLKQGKSKDSSIYVIDSYKNFKKFDSAYEAAKAFNIGVTSILKCAEGDSESVGDFIFAYANDIESPVTNRNGQKVPDKMIVNLASEVLCSIAADKTIPLTIDDALEAKVKSKAKQISKKAAEHPLRQGERIKAPVYAIDKNGRYIKYDKVQDLLDALDISKSSVYKVLRKEKENINGIVFCYDFEVETINEDGEIVPNSRLIKKQINSLKGTDAYATLDLLILRKQQSANEGGQKMQAGAINGEFSGILSEIKEEDLSNTQIRYLQSPFYVVDEKGNYRKFYLQKFVADALGIYKEKISDCLQKRIKSTNGYTFIYASEVESADKKGNIVIDEDKLAGKKESNLGFYLIGADGSYKKFETVQQAHKTLGISYNNILSCILGRQDKTSDWAFIKASDLEIENEDGTISIDQSKLQEKRAFLNKRAVYLVDKECRYKRYETRAAAGADIGVTSQDISAVIIGVKKTIKGYVALDANQVEKIKDDGTVEVLVDKMKEALSLVDKKRTVDVSENGFYAIDKNCNYRKFMSISDASRELDIQYTRILNCLLGVEKMAKGYVYAPAEEIETEQNGEVSVDMKKVEERAAFFQNKAIYAISKNGQYTKYPSQKSASEALDIPLASISRCVNKKIKETFGYTFLLAVDVELGVQDDKVVLDEDLIQEKVDYLNRAAVYAIDREGKYQKFQDRDSIASALNVSKDAVSECLKGKHNSSHGYVFAYPSEVEKKLEDGTVAVDEDKIQEKLQLFRRTTKE